MPPLVDTYCQIGHFTLDNARNNDTAMRELSRLLQHRNINFDATDRRITCFPHVLNICSRRVIDEYVTISFDSVDTEDAWVDTFNNHVIDKDAYLEAVERDPVALGREVVRVVRASSLRREDFSDVLKSGNEKGWFLDEDDNPVKLPVVELLRDVKTRWDSVYYMINRLRVLKQVIFIPLMSCNLTVTYLQALNYFFLEPPNRDIADRKLEDIEWQVLEDLEVVLDVSVFCHNL